MIICLKKGDSSRRVADRLGCSHPKILYWKQRFEENGIGGLNTKPRKGRPVRISKRHEEGMVKKLKEGSLYGWRTKAVTDLISRETGVRYSDRHTRRLLKKWGFALIRPRKRHINRASREEIEAFKKRLRGL